MAVVLELPWFGAIPWFFFASLPFLFEYSSHLDEWPCCGLLLPARRLLILNTWCFPGLAFSPFTMSHILCDFHTVFHGLSVNRLDHSLPNAQFDSKKYEVGRLFDAGIFSPLCFVSVTAELKAPTPSKRRCELLPNPSET